MNPMHILLISPFARDAARGNSVAAARLAQGFKARGHQVTQLDAIAQRDPAEWTPAFHRPSAPDLALILHAAHGARAAAVAREAGIPYVVSLRGTDANEMLADPLRGPAIRETLAHAAAITVFHEPMRSMLVSHLPDIAGRVTLVPNGLALNDAGDPDRDRFGIPPDACVFVSLAGLRAVKQPDYPIVQLAPLIQRHPQIRFLRAGPDLEADVAKRVRDLVAAHAWVVDAGVIPHATIAGFLKAADVFVSASRSEGMPHAVREAMVCGLPLLLSDIPGHRAMADTEALFFDSPESFRAATLRLVKDPELRTRLGAAGRQRVLSEGAPHHEIDAYLTLFQHVTTTEG